MWNFKQEVLWRKEHFVRQSLRALEDFFIHQEGQQATDHLPTWIFALKKLNFSHQMYVISQMHQADVEKIAVFFLIKSPHYWC